MISGNTDDGVVLLGVSGVVVQGNKIGSNAAGASITNASSSMNTGSVTGSGNRVGGFVEDRGQVLFVGDVVALHEHVAGVEAEAEAPAAARQLDQLRGLVEVPADQAFVAGYDSASRPASRNFCRRRPFNVALSSPSKGCKAVLTASPTRAIVAAVSR